MSAHLCSISIQLYVSMLSTLYRQMHLGLNSSVLDRLASLLLLVCGLVYVSDRSGAVEGRSVVLSHGVSLEDTFGKVWVCDKEPADGRHVSSSFNELLDVLGVVTGSGEDDGGSLRSRILEGRVGFGVIGRSGIGREVDASDNGSQGVVGLEDALLGVLGLGHASPVSGFDEVNVLQ